jgi:hypothetical protein
MRKQKMVIMIATWMRHWERLMVWWRVLGGHGLLKAMWRKMHWWHSAGFFFERCVE